MAGKWLELHFPHSTVNTSHLTAATHSSLFHKVVDSKRVAFLFILIYLQIKNKASILKKISQNSCTKYVKNNYNEKIYVNFQQTPDYLPVDNECVPGIRDCGITPEGCCVRQAAPHCCMRNSMLCADVGYKCRLCQYTPNSRRVRACTIATFFDNVNGQWYCIVYTKHIMYKLCIIQLFKII